MTRLEPEDGRSWDKYSAQWGELEEGGLGVEWGTEELTLRLFENCLRPHLTPESHVLEIGPGGGKYSVLTAPLCARLVCADVSSQMLERVSRALADRDNVETLKLGGVDLSGVADESIDFAFSIDVFVHLDLEDVYGYLRELQRVLRPGSAVVIHFANLLSRPGWARFHRIADYNRSMRRQVGRMNFVIPEVITKLFREVRFEGVEVDTEHTSPRDFTVTARKPVLPPDPERDSRAKRILERTRADSVAVDFVHRLAYGVQAPSDTSSISADQHEPGGDRRQIILARPDARVGFALTVPENATLCGAVALHPEAQVGGSDCGVSFEAQVIHALGITTVFSKTLDPKVGTGGSGWSDFEAGLDRFAGQVVFVVFETRTAEGADLANGACWGEPAIVQDEQRAGERRRDGSDGDEVDLRFHDPAADLTAERDALRRHAATIEKERDSLLGHVANIEHERDALVGHAANLERELADRERELGAVREHAGALERDLDKIRSNLVYRLLCRVRDLFAPKG